MSSEHNDEDPRARIERASREMRLQADGLPERQRRADMPAPAPAERFEFTRLAYVMGDLTGSHHRTFVEGAFRALLKRAPEPDEVTGHLARLAAGARKVEILGDLLWSPEGRRIGAHVRGLRARYLLAKATRVPVLGYLLDRCLDVAALPLQPRHQRAVETALAARDEATREALDAVAARLDALAAQDRMLAEQDALLGRRIDEMRNLAHEARASLDELQRASAHVERRLHERADGLEQRIAVHDSRVDEFEFIRQRFYAINHWTHSLDQAFAQIELAASAQRQRNSEFAAQVVFATVAADRDRSGRNSAWADQLAQRLPRHARVLVLASGTDWLAALAERGLDALAAAPNEALGNDANADRVEALSVRRFLRDCENACADGLGVLALPSLTRSLPMPEFLGEATRILRPGGNLLLAFAREPVALFDNLLGEALPVAAPDLTWHALAAAGFVDIARADAADGTIALIARLGPGLGGGSAA